MEPVYINCAMMNPQADGQAGLSDVSQSRNVKETSAESTYNAGTTEVHALRVIK